MIDCCGLQALEGWTRRPVTWLGGVAGELHAPDGCLAAFLMFGALESSGWLEAVCCSGVEASCLNSGPISHQKRTHKKASHHRLVPGCVYLFCNSSNSPRTGNRPDH